jgi:hypothetical protein
LRDRRGGDAILKGGKKTKAEKAKQTERKRN